MVKDSVGRGGGRKWENAISLVAMFNRGVRDMMGGQCMGGWVGGWVDGWMDGWMDGWTDGWMAGRTDGWMDGILKHRKLWYIWTNLITYSKVVKYVTHTHNG